MRRRSICLAVALLIAPLAAKAQTTRVNGRVADQAGLPLVAVRVVEKGTLNETLTNPQGRYEIRVGDPRAVIVFTRVGYREEERPAAAVLDVSLTEAVSMGAIEIVGSRRVDRAPTTTALPVDVIDLPSVTTASGQLDLNQLLQYVVPSFNATRQSGADGGDHIDPASLRGLGPDQTLVLINGKRRHQSSLINIFGSRGRGNNGTDLNAVPISAIDHIEVLRDGASAQYGSDAIAGVVNIVLKSRTDGLTADIATGIHNASAPSKYDVTSSGTDGGEFRVSGNYGMPVKSEGYLNLTGEFLKKGNTNRPADPATFSIYRNQFGDAALDNGSFFLNTMLPLNGSKAFYAFGGANLRHTDAFAWTRDPDSERNVPAIYPNGFDPHITSSIRDLSLSAGMRARAADWNIDLNTTSGQNRFHYNVEATLNASIGAQSPTEFDAGGFALFQNTTGLHLSKLMPGVLEGLNVAFGAEHRYERYSIFAGEEGSYGNYNNGAPGAPAGAQGFPGFQPADEIAEGRTNLGVYGDLELDAGKRVTLGGATRFEHYSDFGNTLTGKASMRVALTDAIAVRGSASTGFRAPSLAQKYFNSTFTDVVSGSIVDKVIARNNSAVAAALGIPELEEEKSRSAGVGLTARFGEFSLAIDGYWVNIDNRIVLTGAFEDTDPDIGAVLQALNVSAAQFFTNAIDTRTRGLDVVLAHQFYIGNQRLRLSAAANFNDMDLGDIHTTSRLAGKEDTYFGAREQAFLLASAPASKMSVTLDHNISRLDTQVRVTNFGRTQLVDWLDTQDVYRAKATVDLSLGYRVNDKMRITVGGANILNVYPSQQDTETETGGLWDAVQMGFSGAFYFARLSIRM